MEEKGFTLALTLSLSVSLAWYNELCSKIKLFKLKTDRWFKETNDVMSCFQKRQKM